MLQNIGRNALGDPLRRLMNRVVRQMGVARGRLDIAVAEQLANHWQGLAERQRAGRVGVARIINQGSTGVICEPMLSPTRDPDAFTDSFARCA